TIDSFTEDSVCISIVGRGSGGKDSLKKGELVRVRAFRESVGLLMAPQTGSMDRRIGESIDAEIHVEFLRDGKALYEGKTLNSGLEIVGDRNEL
ncbi:MAG: hypothetical protein JEY91_16915, partial [Spirochaetaceae bacterium]|nr:hypothetical protein [Spirochaetaceae bacterium]